MPNSGSSSRSNELDTIKSLRNSSASGVNANLIKPSLGSQLPIPVEVAIEDAGAMTWRNPRTIVFLIILSAAALRVVHPIPIIQDRTDRQWLDITLTTNVA
jgi:hypothetical protein